MSERNEAYADAGVNIELGDELSDTLYQAARQTWGNRQGRFGELQELVASFSGFRAMPAGMINDIENVYLMMGDDGVGTKIEVAERMANHETVAFDMFAMVCDDVPVRGGEAIAVTSTLDVRKLEDVPEHAQAIRQLSAGYIKAAAAAGVVVINGEVAELGNRVNGFPFEDHGQGDFNYNWNATALWAVHRDRILDGSKLAVGDYLVGLREDGLRSNGLSLARRILETRYGAYWHSAQPPGWNAENGLGSLIQTPSKIYSKAVNDLTGGYDINRPAGAEVHGIAHITGGGLPGKLGRMLAPAELGAYVHSPFFSELCCDLQSVGKIDDETSYRTWGNGHGMVVATPDPDKVESILASHGIETSVIGEVTQSPGVHITSLGRFSTGKVLHFAA